MRVASPIIPSLHYKLGQLLKDAGLPDGVFNIVQFGNEDVAQRVEKIIGDPRTRVSIALSEEMIKSNFRLTCRRSDS